MSWNKKIEKLWILILSNYREDTYTAFALNATKTPIAQAKSQEREEYFRRRFREYMQKFALYLPNKEPLTIDSSLQDQQIDVRVLHASSLFTKPKISNHAR